MQIIEVPVYQHHRTGPDGVTRVQFSRPVQYAIAIYLSREAERRLSALTEQRAALSDTPMSHPQREWLDQLAHRTQIQIETIAELIANVGVHHDQYDLDATDLADYLRRVST